MEKFYNTAGPNKPDIHYTIDPLTRWNLGELLQLIDAQKYFILHAPRQTGKTSALLAFVDYLNKRDKYKAFYINVEAAQAARENIRSGMESILYEIGAGLEFFLNDTTIKDNYQMYAEKSEHSMMLNPLSDICQMSDKPIVLFIDEVDSLIGDTLISLLRQVRSGYAKRPASFPQSIILCGVRDVRDYRIHSASEKTIITGGSAFNIKSESLRLGNFTKEEVEQLLQLHTTETGQQFETGIIDIVMKYTGGQPWLVNALAYEVCFRQKANRDRSIIITRQHFAEAKENLIIRRDTHLDQLIDKLKEPRVKRVIEPILATQSIEGELQEDDTTYVRDLGLITIAQNGEMQIANEIYREIIPRELSWNFQVSLTEKPAWYITEKGNINTLKMVGNFQQFFRENSEIWLERFDYKEAGPQLLLQAFLQRIINGGGRVEREYAYGTKRTDILIKWFFGNNQTQTIVIELKIKYGTLQTTIKKGLEQTAEYMDKCGTTEGHLLIFDRSKNKTWDEKIFQKDSEYEGKMIKVWGM